MSVLTYNGITIQLTKTNEFRSVAVMSRDGMDVIGTLFHLDVTGVINPAATSYATPYNSSDVLLPVSPLAKQSPATTYDAIHGHLNVNRQALSFSYGSKVVLQSPPLDAKGNSLGTDVAGGPTVLLASITPMGDTKTFFVRFVVETTLDDCSHFLPTPNPYPLASNRWSTTHAIDDRHYTRINVRGIAAFRLDSLSLANVPADSLRDLVLPAIPFGFRREGLVVSVDSSERFMTYECVDQQMPYSLGDPTSSTGFVTPASLGVQGFAATAISGAPPFTRDGGNGFAIAGPMTIYGLQVKAWGNSSSTRKKLLAFCVQMGLERLGLSAGDPKANGGAVLRSVQVSEELHIQEVTLRLEVWRNPGDGKVKPNAVGLGLMLAQFLGVDAMPITFPADANAMLPGGTHPQLPKDTNSRGTWDGQILVQLLKQGCTAPYLNNNCSDADYPNNPPNYTCEPTFVRYTTDQTALARFGFNNPNKLKANLVGIGTHYKVKRAILVRQAKKAAPVADRKKRWATPGPGTGYPVIPPPGRQSITSTGSTPTAAPTTLTEIMVLAAPITFLAVEWTAESLGGKPTLPAPVDATDGLVLISQTIEPMAIETIDGFTNVYRISGRYEYAARVSVDPDRDSIFMGIVPISDIDVAAATINPSDFDPTVLWST